MPKSPLPALVIKLSTLPVVVPFSIAAAYLLWLIQAHALPGIAGFSTILRIGLPDMMLTYAPSAIHEKLAAFGVDGRTAYRAFLTRVDSIFPAIYGIFYLTATAFALMRAFPERPGLHHLSLLTLGTSLFDWAENICFLRMLSHYPQELVALERIANTFTLIKWGFAFFSSALVVFGVLALVLRVRRPQLAS